MAHNIVIRSALPTDAVAYRELRLEALRNHPTAFSASYDEQVTFPDEFWQERINSNIDSPNNVIFFAVSDETLVGMAGTFFTDSAKVRHVGNMTGVYVRPALRGGGVAGKLIDACLAWAKEHNLRYLKLAVAATNTDAIRCYLSRGFSVYGVERDAILYNGDYYDELWMSRRV